MDYNYRKKYKYRRDYNPSFGYNNEDNFESSYIDDYTTSAISYEESMKRQHLTSPHSKSEYGRPRHRERESYRHKSPIADYDDFYEQDDSIKKRSRQTRNDPRDEFIYQFETESDKFKNIDRKSRSPGRRDYYEDSIVEEPKAKWVGRYDKFFKKVRLKDKSPKKYTIDDVEGEDRKKNKWKNFSRKENDYQVFAYKESQLHNKVFRGSIEKNREKSPVSSEIEIKSTDYPILAFKDNNIPVNKKTHKTSSVFYLPTVYCKDKRSKSQGKTKRRKQLSQPGDTQVFAANVDEKKNIFAQENDRIKQNTTNQAVSELQTEESLLSRITKLKEDANARTSTETQTEESSIFENNFPITQSYKNTGSILGSILEKKLKLKDNNSSRETRGSKQYESATRNKDLFSYQIDIDIEPVKKNMTESRVSKIDSTTYDTRQIEYKQIEETLRDDYPVTKDYIKVSDNSSIQMKTSQPSETSARTPTNLGSNVKSNKKVVRDSDSELKKYKRVIHSRDPMNSLGSFYTSRANELVIKDIPETSFNKTIQYDRGNENHRKSVLNHTDFESEKITGYPVNPIQAQDIHVFRSMVSNTPKKSVTKKSTIDPQKNQPTRNQQKQLSQVDDKMSILSYNTNQQSEQQIFKGEPPDAQKERMSVANQREVSVVGNKSESNIEESRLGSPNSDSPLVNRKSQSVIRESKVDRPNRDSHVVDRKSQSVIREPSVDRLNKDAPLLDRKSQSVIRESRVDRPNKDAPLVDRKSQSVIRESKVGRPKKDSTPVDRKSQSVIRESKVGRPNKDSSPVDRKSQSVIRESRVERPNYASDIDEENNEIKPKSTKQLKSSRTAKADKPSESRSILRTAAEPRKKSGTSETKPADSENINFQEEKPIVTDNLEPKEGRSSFLRKSWEPKTQNSEIRPSRKSETKEKTSKTKFSKLFSRSKSNIQSEDDVETHRESRRQSSARKSGQYTKEERKSGKSPSSKPKATTSNKKFSNLFSRKSSKSRLGEEKDDDNPESKGPSKSSLSPAEDNKALNKDDGSLLSKQAPSQATSKKKSKSKKGSTTKNELETNSTGQGEPYSETPGDIDKTEKKQEPVGRNKKENVSKEDKPCECVIQYVKQARECGNFFLGTTLHEQIMDILKVV